MKPDGSRPNLLLSAVAFLLLANGAAAFYAVAKARSVAAPSLECARKKWGWTGALEQLEWNLRRWEMYAPKCLAAGLPLAVPRDDPPGYEILHVESVRPVVADSAPPDAFVTAEQSFRPGADVVVCGDRSYQRGRIGSSIEAGRIRTKLKLEFEGGKTPENLARGMLVVQVTPARYSLVPRRDGSGSTLTAEDTSHAAAPIASGVSSFRVETGDPGPDGVPIRIRLEAERCLLETAFDLGGAYPHAAEGAYLAQNNDLVFAAWAIPEEPPKKP